MAGLFQAILDAIQGEDNRIGGQALTRLSSQLSETESSEMLVESTLGFGEYTDGVGDALLLLGGEIVAATGRTIVPPYKFTALTRGEGQSKVKAHPQGTLVFDLSRNTSAVDRLWRGFLVNFAVGIDLDIIGRNLGLEKCQSITEVQWRALIKAMAYLPKQTIDAFTQVLTALVGAGNFSVLERNISDPWKVFVEIDTLLSTDLRGRFMLNGGEPQDTIGAFTVDTTYPINHVIGVYPDTPGVRRGNRDGVTNYFSGGGSFLGSTITLGSSPGASPQPVIIDYGAFAAHYLADDETVFDTGDDYYAYLADSTLAAKCILEQVRAAGVRVDVRSRY